jgi:hypothetical protein
MSRLYNYINEEYAKSLKVRGNYIEVFKNPSRKEFNEIIGKDDVLRAFLVDDDIYIWSVFGGLHYDIDKKMNFGKKALPIYCNDIFSRSIGVMITDYSKNTKWYHNPDVVNYIREESYFSGKRVNISYFDKNIVGDWEDL